METKYLRATQRKLEGVNFEMIYEANNNPKTKNYVFYLIQFWVSFGTYFTTYKTYNLKINYCLFATGPRKLYH